MVVAASQSLRPLTVAGRIRLLLEVFQELGDLVRLMTAAPEFLRVLRNFPPFQSYTGVAWGDLLTPRQISSFEPSRRSPPKRQAVRLQSSSHLGPNL